MRQYEFDSVANLRYEVRDVDDALADATVTLTVTPPSGVPTTPVVTTSSTGLYDAAVPLDEYGPWRYRWQATGAVNDVDSGQLYVADTETDLPPLATFARLVRKLGYTPTDGERDRAESLLVDASEMIRDVAGKTWVDALNALDNVPPRVASICVAATYRAFGNPEGLSQRSIGDSSKSYDRAKREGGEDLYLTRAEEAAIHKAADGSSLVAVTLVSPYNGTTLDDDGELIWA